MGRQKSGISMLSLQRMLDIPSYKTVQMHRTGDRPGALSGFSKFSL